MKRITLVLIICLSVLFLTSYVSKAQGQDLSEELIEMFSLLDKNKIGTGYLLDQSPDFVDIARFDGSALVDSNYVDIGVFEGFFRCLNGAKVSNNLSLYNATSIVSDLHSTGENDVKIGVALLEYNYIVANALTDNLITYSNGLVDDAFDGNVWKNPYGQRYACLITTGNPIVEGLSVYYSFDFYDNFWTSIDPSSIEIDFGNGQGYVSVASGYSGTINYSNYGTVEIKLRIVLEDDSVLLSHTSVTLTPPPTQLLDVGLQYDMKKCYSAYWEGETVKANVSFKYYSGTGQLVKPLIYVKGFDDQLLKSSNRDDYESFIGYYDYYQDALNVDYDIVFVDWCDTRADIRANALLLEQIINDVNDIKHQNGSNERNIVAGHSMGGLVARYALAKMEQRTIPQLHETDYYVSYDAPHLGANLPSGIQFALRDLIEFFCDDSYVPRPCSYLAQKLIGGVLDILDCNSVKQMLYRRILSSGVENNDSHLLWQEELNTIGFPRGDKGFPIENLSIALGNTVSGGSYLSSPIGVLNVEWDDSLFDWIKYLLNLGNISNLNTQLTINRHLNYNDIVSDLTISYTKHFSWLSNTPFENSSVVSISHRDASSGIFYDKLPSSKLEPDIDTVIPQYLSDFVSISDVSFAFIPVASALSVSDYSYSRDFHANPPSPLIETPFSSFRTFPLAAPHDNPFAVFLPWLKDQFDISINGPGAIIRHGDIITVSDPSNYSSHQSSFLGSSNVSINSNDVISLIDSTVVELVTFSYSNSNNNVSHHKHRKFLTGFPIFVLSTYEVFANNFTITANCGNDQINEFLEDAATGGKISFVWGVKIGSGDIQWSDTSSRSFSINPQSTTYVYCKIRDDRGRESTIKGTTIIPNNGPPQSLVNYDPRIIYTFMGNSSLYYSIIDGSNLNDNYFVVWSKPLRPFSQTPDRIIINGQTIMRDTVSTETIGGTSTTIYCFKIFDSNQIQSVISNIDSYPGNTTTVSGMLYGGSTWLQDFTITITKGLPPL